ncbi:hypothetical protein B0T21DRAFT_385958 [Apiosordaria backusii]|uniref:Uncharacterized protein n=1 Tax=Apiosordaria backusii TaxID=314023 RepID=A0AA40AXE6_9PEZI|nr:hypothetical protein B0T21DRAFT_385958 [Apiosordaria backusii]
MFHLSRVRDAYPSAIDRRRGLTTLFARLRWVGRLSINSARLHFHRNTDSPRLSGFRLKLLHTATIATKDHFRKGRQQRGGPVGNPPPYTTIADSQLKLVKELVGRGNVQADTLHTRIRALIDLSLAYRREETRLLAEMERQIRVMNKDFSLADLDHIIALHPEDDADHAAAVEFHDVLEWLNDNGRAMRQSPAVSEVAYNMATWKHSAHLFRSSDMYPNTITLEQLVAEAEKVDETLKAAEDKIWLMHRELDSIVAVTRLLNGLGGRWDPFAHMLKRELY